MAERDEYVRLLEDVAGVALEDVQAAAAVEGAAAAAEGGGATVDTDADALGQLLAIREDVRRRLRAALGALDAYRARRAAGEPH
jgi:hypothetical protein